MEEEDNASPPASAEGYRIGTVKRKFKKPLTKDRNAERFWAQQKDIVEVCQLKASKDTWGKRKIYQHLLQLGKSISSETKVGHYLEKFFFDHSENALFFKSCEANVQHRRCVTKDQLIDLLRQEHERDHRSAETCYESLRGEVYPVVRDTVGDLFRANILCDLCKRQAPLPKTTLIRAVILATYPNSRWQIDLKKMPAHNGYEYCCNIIDCYSRFAMGAAIKNKSAKAVCEVVVDKMFAYGPPRILQSDNGKEFNNSALSAVVDEMKTMKIHGRPYHPQSQGRVERLNQTLARFFRRDLLVTKDWPSRLKHFYYAYNNRVHSTTGKAPMEQYLRRPNFSLFTPQARCNLTHEEQEFLDTAHLDVTGTESDCEDNFDAGGLATAAPAQPDVDAGAYPLELQWEPQPQPGASTEPLELESTSTSADSTSKFSVGDLVFLS